MVEIITSFDDLCRLCAGKIDALMAFNMFAADQRDLLKKITSCLPIDVSASDNFPKAVCMECACKLDLMFEFRERCLLTAHLFEEMLATETVLVLPEQHVTEGAVLLQNDDLQACEEIPCKLDDKEIPLEAAPTIERNIIEESLQSAILEQSVIIENKEKTVNVTVETIRDVNHVNIATNRNEKQSKSKKQPNKVKGKAEKNERKVCLECGKVCSSNYKLSEHMRRHTGEKPYICSYGDCKKSFRSKIGLAQHEASHSGHFEFSCVTCGKGFQCKSYLVVHQRVHSDAKPYPCQHCTRSFKTKQSLLDHVNRHLGVKPFLCDICGRGFITKGLCKSHQKVHSGTDNRQFPCHICRKLFVSKSYLNTHLRIHTGEKPFKCEVCGKGFLTRVDLRVHTTLHTGEKKFVCETCGKAFARRDALRCHRRSHTGERPYKCDFCGQSFTQFSPMAIHKRLHTGERPYECDICSRSFVSRSTMLAHRKKHHDSDSPSKDIKQELPLQTLHNFSSSEINVELRELKTGTTENKPADYMDNTLNVDLLDIKDEYQRF